MTVLQVAAGLGGGMRGRWATGWKVCPLCAGWRYHTLREHRALVRLIRHPLEPVLWGEDDLRVVSKGHHPPGRFLAAIQTDDSVAWALDWNDTDPVELDALEVRHEWYRYLHTPRGDGERGWWKRVDGPGPQGGPLHRGGPAVTAAPATLAIRDQLLAVLRDAQGFPLSTLQVCEQAGPMAWPPDAVTWKHLAALAKAGVVERVKLPGWRQVWWKLPPPPAGADG